MTEVENIACELRKQYFRAYREKNREHLREYNRKYQKTHKQQISKSQKTYWQRKAQKIIEENMS